MPWSDSWFSFWHGWCVSLLKRKSSLAPSHENQWQCFVFIIGRSMLPSAGQHWNTIRSFTLFLSCGLSLMLYGKFMSQLPQLIKWLPSIFLCPLCCQLKGNSKCQNANSQNRPRWLFSFSVLFLKCKHSRCKVHWWLPPCLWCYRQAVSRVSQKHLTFLHSL